MKNSNPNVNQEHRIEPICSHFGSCGGCATQDIDYNYELQNKEEEFRNLFPNLEADLIDPIHYHEPHGYRDYRARMDFLFHNHSLCQRFKGNFRIKVALNECHIAHPAIALCLQKLNQWFQDTREDTPYLTSPDNFNFRLLKYVTIRKPSFTDGLSVTFVVNREAPHRNQFEDYLKSKESLDSLLKLLSPLNPNILIGYVNPKQELSVTTDFQVLHGSDTLKEILHEKTFSFHSQGFFQNNSRMINKIIDTVKDWMDDYRLTDHDGSPGKGGLLDLYDLYGGCGVFGVSLADRFKKVWVVDTEGLNIELADKNFRENGLNHHNVVMRNVKDFLEWEEYTESMDESIVILDPPRSGLGNKVIKRLLKRKPRAIFYVSCNVRILAQELDSFRESKLYQIKRMAPFDLFPRTPHLEALALLTRNS